MKTLSIKQLVLLGLGVVVVVFGAAYARMYIGAPPPSPGAQGVKAAQLTFSSVLWPEEAADQAGPPYEMHVPAHHAFWYRNDTDKPVDVSLISKTCKCTKVEMSALPPDLKDAAPEALDHQTEAPSLTWKPLEAEEEGRPFTVPAHAAGGVRLNWKGETLGPKGLAADLRTESAGATGDPIHLEARVNFVVAMRVSAEALMMEAPLNTNVSVGTLEERDTRFVNLLCWSATRDHFNVQVQAEPPADPCVTVGKVAKFKAKCDRFGQQVRCAYRVPVTVRERTADGHQLDLGHFRRYFRFTSPDPGIESFSFGITGVVRGDLTVKGHDDRSHVIADQVPLGSFERGTGATTDVTLATDRSDLDLEIESHPDFLKVRLEEVKDAEQIGKVWTMWVTAPPDSCIGPLQHGTDIVLKTKGDHPRRIRIPVTGNSYVK